MVNLVLPLLHGAAERDLAESGEGESSTQPACHTCLGTSGPYGLLRHRDLLTLLSYVLQPSYLAFVTSQTWGHLRVTATLDLGKTQNSC
jgi:hypothetical protein